MDKEPCPFCSDQPIVEIHKKDKHRVRVVHACLVLHTYIRTEWGHIRRVTDLWNTRAKKE